MTSALDLETERIPLGEVVGSSTADVVRPFGLSVTRWDRAAKFERERIHLDPDTQLGMVGERPLHTVITAGTTTCQINSDGQTVITLDYPVDDNNSK
jgi:hypothetical protein